MTVNQYSNNKTLDDVFRSKKLTKRLVESLLPLSKMIDVRPNSVTCCPFHNDTTPSAKIFVEEDGTEKLYCFTEHRHYTSYDYISLILGEDPKIFLLSELKEESLNSIIKNIDFSDKHYNKEYGVILNRSSNFLPNMVSFFEHLYPHSLET